MFVTNFLYNFSETSNFIISFTNKSGDSGGTINPMLSSRFASSNPLAFVSTTERL